MPDFHTLINVYTSPSFHIAKEDLPGVYKSISVPWVTKGICSEYVLNCIWDADREEEIDLYEIKEIKLQDQVFGHSVLYDKKEIFSCLVEKYS